MPATAAIARTSVNIKSGGVTRLVPILHGVALLAAALLLADVIGKVPLAALAGVLMVTAWRMNEWHTIHFYFDHRLKHAMLAFVITLAATVVLDLTQAILIGFGISTLIFMAQMSELQITRKPVEVERLTELGESFVHPGHNIAVYYLSGPLFFAAARRLLEFVERNDGPDATMILSMRGVPLVDATGVEVIRELLHRQRHGGGDVLLTSMDNRVQVLLQRAGLLAELGEDHVYWSADKAIAALGLRVESLEPQVAAPVAEPSIVEAMMVAPFAEKMGAVPDEAGDAARCQADPLARPVQEVMRAEVVTVSPDTPAAEVVTLLLEKGYRSLPVVAENGHLLGIITDGDLLRRANLSTRLDLHRELAAEDWQRQLAELRAQTTTAANLMSAPVLTVPVSAPLRQAVELMVTHHLKRVPVVQANGRLAGWVSRVDILRTLDHHQLATEPESETARTGATIADLMYRDVPTVTAQASLEEILQALEQNRRRRAVVVDGERRVVGIITDGDLLRRAQQASRPGLLARLRGLLTGQPSATPVYLPASTETAADLMSAPAITIAVDAAPAAALRLMLEHSIKRLPVVDAEGRLVGLLGRGSVLHALMPAIPAADAAPVNA